MLSDVTGTLNTNRKRFMSVTEEKSFQFAVEVVNAAKRVRSEHKEYGLTGQFVRSGT